MMKKKISRVSPCASSGSRNQNHDHNDDDDRIHSNNSDGSAAEKEERHGHNEAAKTTTTDSDTAASSSSIASPPPLSPPLSPCRPDQHQPWTVSTTVSATTTGDDDEDEDEDETEGSGKFYAWSLPSPDDGGNGATTANGGVAPSTPTCSVARDDDADVTIIAAIAVTSCAPPPPPPFRPRTSIIEQRTPILASNGSQMRGEAVVSHSKQEDSDGPADTVHNGPTGSRTEDAAAAPCNAPAHKTLLSPDLTAATIGGGKTPRTPLPTPTTTSILRRPSPQQQQQQQQLCRRYPHHHRDHASPPTGRRVRGLWDGPNELHMTTATVAAEADADADFVTGSIDLSGLGLQQLLQQDGGGLDPGTTTAASGVVVVVAPPDVISMFERLREETLVFVLSYLPLADLLRSSMVCRRWRYHVTAASSSSYGPSSGNVSSGCCSGGGASNNNKNSNNNSTNGCCYGTSSSPLWRRVDATTFCQEAYRHFVNTRKRRMQQQQGQQQGQLQQQQQRQPLSDSSSSGCNNTNRNGSTAAEPATPPTTTTPPPPSRFPTGTTTDQKSAAAVAGTPQQQRRTNNRRDNNVRKKKNKKTPEQWAREETARVLRQVLSGRQPEALIISNIGNALCASHFDLQPSLLSSLKELTLTHFDTLTDAHLQFLLLMTLGGGGGGGGAGGGGTAAANPLKPFSAAAGGGGSSSNSRDGDDHCMLPPKIENKIQKARSYNALRTLKLEYCSLLTNDCLVWIARTCRRHLLHLSLRGNGMITQMVELQVLLVTKLRTVFGREEKEGDREPQPCRSDTQNPTTQSLALPICADMSAPNEPLLLKASGLFGGFFQRPSSPSSGKRPSSFPTSSSSSSQAGPSVAMMSVAALFALPPVQPASATHVITDNDDDDECMDGTPCTAAAATSSPPSGATCTHVASLFVPPSVTATSRARELPSHASSSPSEVAPANVTSLFVPPVRVAALCRPIPAPAPVSSLFGVPASSNNELTTHNNVYSEAHMTMASLLTPPSECKTNAAKKDLTATNAMSVLDSPPNSSATAEPHTNRDDNKDAVAFLPLPSPPNAAQTTGTVVDAMSESSEHTPTASSTHLTRGSSSLEFLFALPGTSPPRRPQRLMLNERSQSGCSNSSTNDASVRGGGGAGKVDDGCPPVNGSLERLDLRETAITPSALVDCLWEVTCHNDQLTGDPAGRDTEDTHTSRLCIKALYLASSPSVDKGLATAPSASRSQSTSSFDWTRSDLRRLDDVLEMSDVEELYLGGKGRAIISNSQRQAFPLENLNEWEKLEDLVSIL